MRKNLRTSSAGSAPRANAVRRGALSMKMGAFISVAGILALPLVLAASAQATGSAQTLSSTLTSTTTSQILNLTTAVTLNPSGSWHWSFTLSNPMSNTVRIRSFTAAPFWDLSGATNIGQTPNPGGLWTFEGFAVSPQVDPAVVTNTVDCVR